MSIIRQFRSRPQASRLAENPEVTRILRRGAQDKPAGIRHNHTIARSMIGWW